MKKNGDYWEGKNGNKWSTELYTKEQAIAAEKTLVNCKYMVNCSYCFDCSDCYDCSGCSSCSRCSRCSNSSGCSGCSDCSGCSGCSGFKSNPCRYVGRVMGSRKSQTTTYWMDSMIQVVCGCFCGTLDEFEDAVEKTHGVNAYGAEYRKYIRTVRTIIAIEQEEPR